MTGRIPQYEVDAASKGFDLKPWLSERDFEPNREAMEWIGPCPNCGKQKLTVNFQKRVWHCWVCEAEQGSKGRGGLVNLIQLYEPHLSFPAVIRYLQRHQGQSDPGTLEMDDQPAPARFLQTIPWPEGATAITQPLPYMLRRRLTMQDVQDFGLFYCAFGRYRDRLVFPCFHNGALVYYQARAMWEKSEQPEGVFIKAMNPKRDDCPNTAREVLFNWDRALWEHHQRGARLAITEGPIDAVRAGPSAIATLGHSLSAVQANRIRDAGIQRIDFMWDADAHEAMRRALPRLIGLDVRIVDLPEGMDPGDLDRPWLDSYRAYAVPVADFLSRFDKLELNLA